MFGRLTACGMFSSWSSNEPAKTFPRTPSTTGRRSTSRSPTRIRGLPPALRGSCPGGEQVMSTAAAYRVPHQPRRPPRASARLSTKGSWRSAGGSAWSWSPGREESCRAAGRATFFARSLDPVLAGDGRWNPPGQIIEPHQEDIDHHHPRGRPPDPRPHSPLRLQYRARRRHRERAAEHDHRAASLVGRNGAGKTTLAALVARCVSSPARSARRCRSMGGPGGDGAPASSVTRVAWWRTSNTHDVRGRLLRPTGTANTPRSCRSR